MKRPFVRASRQVKRDNSIVVTEPTRPTEFEVQAFIWNGLRAMGINARGEVKTAFNGRACVRFDIAIFDGGVLSGVVEIKSSPIKHKTTWEETRQGERYAQFGVPVRLVYGMDEAKRLLADAEAGRMGGGVP